MIAKIILWGVIIYIIGVIIGFLIRTIFMTIVGYSEEGFWGALGGALFSFLIGVWNLTKFAFAILILALILRSCSSNQIIDRKRHLIHKTITTYGVNALKIAKRNNFGVLAMPFLLYHLVGLGYMTKEEEHMGYGGQDDATARFSITGKGEVLLKKWFV